MGDRRARDSVGMQTPGAECMLNTNPPLETEAQSLPRYACLQELA